MNLSEKVKALANKPEKDLPEAKQDSFIIMKYETIVDGFLGTTAEAKKKMKNYPKQGDSGTRPSQWHTLWKQVM
jgi:hypothetical protein